MTDMVRIPAGTFRMGSNDHVSQQPVHTVHLDAFDMDAYAVTNAQFKIFVDANIRWQKKYRCLIDEEYLHHWDDTDYPAGKANHPVTYVTWFAAMAYAEWAGKRLPTEAEREYAARGGLPRKRYPWGNDEPPIHRSNWHAACLTAFVTRAKKRQQHYEESAEGFVPKEPPAWIEEMIKGEHLPAVANYNSHWGGTTPVGCFDPNGFGLYDMAGNVWEWCLDAFNLNVYAISKNSRNPIAAGETVQWLCENFKTIPDDDARVLRGGSWDSDARNIRVASRKGGEPEVTFNYIGFRCVRDVTP